MLQTRKIKKNSLVTNIWFYLTIFSVLILTFLWLFQIIFLDTYYKHYKTKELNKAAKEIKQEYKNNTTVSLSEIAQKHAICIEIYGQNKEDYTFQNYNQGCMQFGNKNFDVKKDFVSSNLNQKKYNLINDRFNNSTLIYAVKLDNNTYAFLNASLVPLGGTIQILQSQLLYITIVVLILSFLAGYFISKKISNPILKIAKNAKNIANGNYKFKFKSSEIYEINELVESLNYVKKELAKTDELKRDLLANVSHDLKTPLTMIKAYAEMVRDITYTNDAKRENNLNIIIQEADRLNLLVNDILDLSKLEENDKIECEEFDLTKIITEIIDRFAILKEEGYNFKLNLPKQANVYADKNKIYQAIYNLINNAINYTGKDKIVKIQIEEKEKTYLVKIIDTGKGIKQEEIKYIWDKYYHNAKKHKRNAYGTGLGLSIVRNIFQNHNFKYGIKTSKKGSNFYFEITKK